MKLQQYLGGVEGLGPIRFERRVFVEPWEKRVFGIHAAMMGLSKHLSQVPYKYPIAKVPTKFKDQWTWAELRTLAEGMAPLDYIKYRYYEKWLSGLTHALVVMGYITPQELDARTEEDFNNATKPLPTWPSEAIDHQGID